MKQMLFESIASLCLLLSGVFANMGFVSVESAKNISELGAFGLAILFLIAAVWALLKLDKRLRNSEKDRERMYQEIIDTERKEKERIKAELEFYKQKRNS